MPINHVRVVPVSILLIVTVLLAAPLPSVHRFHNALQRMSRVAVLISLLALSPALHADLYASEASPPMRTAALSVGFLQNSFSGVNHLDAEAALKTLGRSIGRSYGYEVDVTVRTFGHVREIAFAPEAERIDLILLDSWSYLAIDEVEWIQPVFVSSDRGEVANRYLLLARGNGLFNTLNDLRGKSLNVVTASSAMLGSPWLEILMQENQLGTPKAFFGSLDCHTDATPAVLQVFFGKRDAVLVDASKFELMSELNPQLNSLRAIEASEPLVNYVICFKRAGWPSMDLKHDLIQALTDLHHNPAGQQIFTLFKFGRLVPYEKRHLDTVRHLRARAGATKTKPPVASPGNPGKEG